MTDVAHACKKYQRVSAIAVAVVGDSRDQRIQS